MTHYSPLHLIRILHPKKKKEKEVKESSEALTNPSPTPFFLPLLELNNDLSQGCAFTFFKHDINPRFDKRLKQREKAPTLESDFDAQFKREMIGLISLGVEFEPQHIVEPAENLPSYRWGADD